MIESLNGTREIVNYKSNTHIRLYQNEEEEYYPNHWHVPLEIIMPVENFYQVTCGINTYDLKEGDVLFISPRVLHSMGASTGGKRIIFQADCSLLDRIKEMDAVLTMISPALHITAENAPSIHGKVRQLLFEIADEYPKEEPLGEASIYAKILNMLVLVGRYISEELGFSNKNIQKREYLERILSICEYINEHHSENITLDDVANLSGFSKYHFSRLFKQFINVSFYKYLNIKRIENAARLLMIHEMTITDVALGCGFSSISAFIRMFKIIKGCTPSEFKMMYQSNDVSDIDENI